MTINIRNYELRDWEELITGVVLKENENWVLIHEIPADYSLDGYLLINKQQITDHFKDEETDQKELVLSLKKYQELLPENFELASVESMLKQIESQYQLIGVQDEEEILHIGTIQSIVANELRIHHIAADGIPDPSMVMPTFLTDIQTIGFGSDYLQSVSLLYKYRMR